jgi:hypothetical protein
VSGKENVTYDGQETQVSFAAINDTSGNNGMHVIVTSNGEVGNVLNVIIIKKKHIQSQV